MSREIVLGITGASGAIYGVRLANLLAQAGVNVHVVATPYGKQVIHEELGISKLSDTALSPEYFDRLTLYSHLELGARISSGSFRTDGMVICPCSANTLAAVSAGLADNLVTRAAAVTLKEGRKLILVPREMPLHTIELENLLRLSRCGAIICPACPGFYNKPQSIDELVDFVCGRILDLLQVPHELAIRWNPGE
ncbi:MAG: UbiX family flavin prenyltransferase [Phycisphaerae bacterium]